MKKKEIHSVHLYQSVVFEKRSETFFSTESVNGKSKKTIGFNEDFPSCLEIKSDKDHIIVPMANVACIYPFTKAKEANIKDKEVEKKKDFGVKASEIKRPGR